MNLDRHDLEDGLEAYALDLLDDTTADAFERALVAHPDLAAQAAELREALAGLAYEDRARAPLALRDGVLGAAILRRRPGIDDTLTAGASAPRCHRAAVDLVSAVIDDLGESDMRAPTIYRIPVIELIRHINGMELQLAQALSSPDGPAVSGLTAGGHRGVRDGSASDTAPTVIDAWHRHSNALEAVVASSVADDGTEFEVGGVAMRADRLLVVRSYEQWTHAEDICRAVGRPLPLPPADVLHTMADHALDLLLPVVGMLTGRDRTTVRVTLTGSGGGSWLRRLGEAHGPGALDPWQPADATLVADVVDFCRLLADRADADIPVHRYGNVGLCDEILDLAPALADYGAGPLH